ncbi:hypothetical protein ACFWOX_09100 [Streptomyces sp. NPDC058467]|uniref:hypothetical protein n=1 Tax=unclassified Streptomyces TaxID=2593676 RepID=UPI00366231C4
MPVPQPPVPGPAAERFAQALARTLTDPALRGRPPTGAVDQWADNADYLAA